MIDFYSAYVSKTPYKNAYRVLKYINKKMYLVIFLHAKFVKKFPYAVSKIQAIFHNFVACRTSHVNTIANDQTFSVVYLSYTCVV